MNEPGGLVKVNDMEGKRNETETERGREYKHAKIIKRRGRGARAYRGRW